MKGTVHWTALEMEKIPLQTIYLR